MLYSYFFYQVLFHQRQQRKQFVLVNPKASNAVNELHLCNSTQNRNITNRKIRDNARR